MELLNLSPPQHGVRISGIYILDDDGNRVLAGPFAAPREAIRWIEMTAPARRAATRRSEEAWRPD